MYTNRRYFILILLFIASMINYIDRAALSILAPYITTDLNVNKAELGLIFSSFAIGYAVFCFIGGWLADKYGPRRIFAGSMGLWSLFAGLTCAAFNFASLFVIRVIFGAAEGPMGSVTNKTIVKWFPVKERARAVGVSFSGNPLGGAVSAPIVAAICITASALVANLYSAIALMSVGMFAMYVTTSCYWAIVQDTVKGNNVGAVSGFIHFLANLAGVVAPMITGFIVQGTGQYYSAFYLVGVLAIVSAVLLMLGGRKSATM